MRFTGLPENTGWPYLQFETIAHFLQKKEDPTEEEKTVLKGKLTSELESMCPG